LLLCTGNKARGQDSARHQKRLDRDRMNQLCEVYTITQSVIHKVEAIWVTILNSVILYLKKKSKQGKRSERATLLDKCLI